jgi:protein SCO1/2
MRNFGIVPLMLFRRLLLLGLAVASVSAFSATPSSEPNSSNAPKQWTASGTIKEVRTNDSTVVVAHDAIGDYMPAMTMRFNVHAPAELAGLSSGDKISFRLNVTDSASWIDHLTKTGTTAAQPAMSPASSPTTAETRPRSRHPLLDFKFTNELNQAVSFSDFRGQALAITFFFTRCPIPEYCPRLSKNFQQASRKLEALPNAPTNWHFISVTFDPENDIPSVLKSYAETYRYDPNHWSFLTGPTNEIGELARLSDVKFQRDGALFNHDFRTQIIDARGRLQMVFPIGGDLSDAIVEEIVKAARTTNAPADSSASH